MPKTLNDGLTREQLRCIDRWTLALLASILAAALFTVLLSSGRFSAQSQSDGWELKGDLPAFAAEATQTTGSGAVGHYIRNPIGRPGRFPQSDRPDGVQGFELPRRLNGEQRQNMPIVD
jgi:hypothetical protein